MLMRVGAEQTQRLQHVLAARRREYLEAAVKLRQEVQREQVRARGNMNMKYCCKSKGDDGS